MEQTITRQEVLNRINNNEVFDIEYATCSKKRRTGGKLLGFAHCVKFTNQSLPKVKLSQFEAEKPKRSHNHKIHSTVTIYRQDHREVKTVYIRLITMFNGKRVI